MAHTKAEADRFIGRHITRHKKMGMSQKQAVAVALHEARDKDYPVSQPRGISSAERGR